MTQEATPRTLSIEEAAELIGISRWLAYEQARSGWLAGVPIIQVGRRKLVSRVALERVLNGEALQAGGDAA